MDKFIGPFRFNMNHLLGRGSYGIVYKGKSQEGYPVAIKVMDKRLLNQDSLKQLLNEIKSMKTLNHPNVVQFLDYYETVNNIYIIQEFCDQGDLRDQIKLGAQDCKTVLNIFQQILNGYYELYKKGIIHRDIKPANILCHQGVIKLADFGFAKRIDFENDLMTSVAGTPLYMAPQVILRQPYTAKCDIWSIGMILFELLYQKPPVKATNILELQEQIQKPIQLPQINNEVLQQIIMGCLQVNEEQRLSWEELYQRFIWSDQKPSVEPQVEKPVEDYYMKQIESYGNPQEQDHTYDYQKFMIQSYLKQEFQTNYQILMNQLDFVKCLYNFCLYICAQQGSFKHELLNRTFNQLRVYATIKLQQLENPTFLKEYMKFLNSELGQNGLQQVLMMKNAFVDKFKEYNISGDLDASELIKTLEQNMEFIQGLQLSHPKLCFLFMSKQIMQIIKLMRQYGPTQLVQFVDIQVIDSWPDQEIMFQMQSL